jgi:DNA-binding TFAR19-related protein (PDSD5 family)
METDPETANELLPLNPIRVETALSRYPVHMLAKKGDINIELNEEDEHGESSLRWRVSYNSGFGLPGPLAYKLDTLIVNRKIEEARRPIPRIICLGSLREIAEQLELGGDTNCVKRALRQNASAFIIARIRYKLPDGTVQKLEADFTRYSVVFTGEKLPNGKKADAVYLILNDVYMQVINGAMVRPLDYDYLKVLPPAPQRFYELVSFPMYGALRYDRHRAKLAYSEFCTYAPQTRYFDWEHVRKQMAKVHAKHKQSGYIAKVEFEPITDSDGQPDWLMFYTPGPKAIAEFRAFTKRGGPVKLEIEPPSQDADAPAAEPIQLDLTLPYRRKQKKPKRPADLAPSLAAELVKRGVSEVTAAELVDTHSEQTIQLKIESFDWLKERKDRRIAKSPSGYLVKSIEDGYAVPEGFTTKAERDQQAELARQQRHAEATKARHKREEANREREEAKRVAVIRQSLTPEQLTDLEADALARATQEERQGIDDPSLGRFRSTLLHRLTDDHIRRLLRSGEIVPPVSE